ncbi:MAG: hypothetical protein WEB00_10990 [Dehalococcoidia bacterium]
MLTAHDDYPIHQTPYPIAHTYSADLNHYDRYFFNGYTKDGSLYFAAALGLYPNRQVMDAAFAVVRGGVEYSLIASRQAPTEPTETEVGPIKVTIEEPMQRLRLTVAPNNHGIECDIVFNARTVPVEEPHFSRTDGTARTFDLTRLTQWGSWEGTITVNGENIEARPADVLGSRDRSWGVRGVGERRTVGPPENDRQFFWLWSPINFDDICVHFDVNEDGEGQQWHANGVVIPVTSSPAAFSDEQGLQKMDSVGHEIAWEKGTRRSSKAKILLHPFQGETMTVELEPILTFQMLGIGYGNPEWAHGLWKGESALHYETWKLDEIDPLAPHMIHIQQLCRARMGDREGMGVLEQAVWGQHRPSGFTALLDGAR